LRSIHDLRHELIDRDLAAFFIGWWGVLAVDGESLPFPHGRAVPLIHDFDIDGELHFAFGDGDRAHVRPNRERHVRVVAHDAAAHKRIGRLFGGDAQPQASLERLTNRFAHLLRQRRLGGVVFERENRDGLDVGERAALKSVRAADKAEAPGANDDYATEPAE